MIDPETYRAFRGFLIWIGASVLLWTAIVTVALAFDPQPDYLVIHEMIAP